MVNSNTIVAEIKASENKLILDASNVEISNNLVVHGDASFNSKVEISNNLLVKGDVSFNKDVEISNNLIVHGDVSFNQDVEISNNLIVHGDASFNSNVEISNNLLVKGEVTSDQLNTRYVWRNAGLTIQSNSGDIHYNCGADLVHKFHDANANDGDDTNGRIMCGELNVLSGTNHNGDLIGGDITLSGVLNLQFGYINETAVTEGSGWIRNLHTNVNEHRHSGTRAINLGGMNQVVVANGLCKFGYSSFGLTMTDPVNVSWPIYCNHAPNMQSAYFTGRVYGDLHDHGSDNNLKSSTESINDALGILNQLKPYKYVKHPKLYTASDSPDLTGHRHYPEIGLIAQDVEQIDYLKFTVGEIELLHEDGSQQVNSDGEGMKHKTLNYNPFITLLIRGVQELHAENAALRASLAALTARIDALEAGASQE